MNKTITFGGATLLPDASGALYWPDEDVLFVADLHLEKASHFAARGYLLPPYDTLETLRDLARVIETYQPGRVVALGDSWHDMRGPERMAEEDRALLETLCADRDFLWISGNHDPRPAGFGPHVAETTLCGLTLTHEATDAATTPTLCGHYHPKVRVRLRRSSRSLPCFALYEHVCVLPSFGAFTGGLEITDDALAKPLGLPRCVYACGKRDIYHLPIGDLSQTGAPDAA